MSGGANIVEQYAGADVPARIELLIKYYPNFIRLVEGYEQSLTVTNESVNMVKEWQISTDQGATYQTANGSGGSDTFTLYNVGANTVVRAIVTKSQTYSLSYRVKLDNEVVSDGNIASLTASSNGQSLASGSTVSAYIPVEFKLTLNDNYYLVGWSSNVEAGEKDNLTATMESLTNNSSVTVIIAEKPVVSYENYQNGTVTATMPDLDNEAEDITVKSGEHVLPGTDVTFIFTPNPGYVVDAGA